MIGLNPNKFAMQSDASDIGHPKLVDARQFHSARQVDVDLQMVMGVRRHHEGPRLHRQQVVLAHNPRHALVVH